MRRVLAGLGAVAALGAVGMAVLVAVLTSFAGAGGSSSAAADVVACRVTVDAAAVSVEGLDAGQVGNAAVILAVAKETFRGVLGPRAGVVGIATAMQESTLRVVDHGDIAGPDSRGLFQQRTWWGPLAERMDPRGSARLFFVGGRDGSAGLQDIAGWESMPVTVAAQRVQRSAFPLAYAKWEILATRLVAQLSGGAVPVGDPCGGTVGEPAAVAPGGVAAALRAGVSLVGVPYVWGGTTAAGVDCSGLVVYGWRQAGHRLRVRTAAQMWGESTEVPAGAEQPGDMVFSEFDGTGPQHMIWVLSRGRAVEAAHTGTTIRVRPYTLRPGDRVGRFKASAFVGAAAAA